MFVRADGASHRGAPSQRVEWGDVPRGDVVQRRWHSTPRIAARVLSSRAKGPPSSEAGAKCSLACACTSIIQGRSGSTKINSAARRFRGLAHAPNPGCSRAWRRRDVTWTRQSAPSWGRPFNPSKGTNPAGQHPALVGGDKAEGTSALACLACNSPAEWVPHLVGPLCGLASTARLLCTEHTPWRQAGIWCMLEAARVRVCAGPRVARVRMPRGTRSACGQVCSV